MAARTPNLEVGGFDILVKSLEEHDQKCKRVIAGIVIKTASEDAVRYMKTNAPWTNRTGNARNGLHAEPYAIEGGKAFEIVVAHSVPYGIWLETRFSGKYAILMPTVNFIGKLLIQRIQRALPKVVEVS